MEIFAKVVGFLRILGLQEYPETSGKLERLVRCFICFMLLLTFLLQIMWNFVYVADSFAEQAETATAMISVFSNYVSFVLLMKERRPLAALFEQMQLKINERELLYLETALGTSPLTNFTNFSICRRFSFTGNI